MPDGHLLLVLLYAFSGLCAYESSIFFDCALLILVHHIWLLLFLAPVLFFLCKVKASRWQENTVTVSAKPKTCLHVLWFCRTPRYSAKPNTVTISAQKWRQPSALCSCVTKWVFHHFSLKLFAAALPLLTFGKHVKINKQNPGNNKFRC